MTCFLSCMVLLLGTPATSGDSWTASFEGLEQAAQNVRTVQADFKQIKLLKILNKPMISTGHLLFSSPSSIRWEYTKPVKSILLMNEGKLERFTQQNGKLVPDAAGRVESMRVVVEEIQGWLTGRFTKSKAFSASLKQGTPVRVVLTPLEQAMAKFIQRIDIELSSTPGVISSVTVVESKNASTRIEFINVVLDGTLNKDVFKNPQKPN